VTKRILHILAVVVIAWALTLNAVAQQQIGVNSRTFSMYPELAKVLELSPQQITDLRKIQAESIDIRYQILGIPRGGSLPRQPIPTEEQRQRLDTAVADEFAKVDKVLKPEQRTKLWEITFQLACGWDSLVLHERIFQTMNPTDVQKEQIRQLLKECDADMKAIQDTLATSARDQEAYEKRTAENIKIRAKYVTQIKSLLTPEQLAKAEKLTAEIPALRERLGLPPLVQPRAANAGR